MLDLRHYLSRSKDKTAEFVETLLKANDCFVAFLHMCINLCVDFNVPPHCLSRSKDKNAEFVDTCSLFYMQYKTNAAPFNKQNK